MEDGRCLISSRRRSVTGKQELWIVTYLRSRGKAFCSLREKPLNCFASCIVVLDETLSTDSERFLFPDAVEDAVRSFWGRAKSPSMVVIAECALLRVEPTLDLNALISYSYPTKATLCAIDPDLRFAANPPNVPDEYSRHPMESGQCDTKRPTFDFSWSIAGVDDPRRRCRREMRD